VNSSLSSWKHSVHVRLATNSFRQDLSRETLFLVFLPEVAVRQRTYTVDAADHLADLALISKSYKRLANTESKPGSSAILPNNHLTISQRS
jgi:hypothetical protein